MIPEAAVEAALESAFSTSELARTVWEPTIQAILEAAAPHMLADLRKLVEDMEAQPWTEMGTVRGMAALIRSTMSGTL
jgi:hypothetical protein